MTDEELWILTDEEKRAMMTEQHECEWGFSIYFPHVSCKCGETMSIKEANARLNEYEIQKNTNAALLEALRDSAQYLGKLAADNEGNFLGRSAKGRLDQNTILIRKASQ